jgi:hypothetical protein
MGEDLQTFIIPFVLHSSLVEKSLGPSSRENHNTHFISAQRPQNRSVYETISKKHGIARKTTDDLNIIWSHTDASGKSANQCKTAFSHNVECLLFTCHTPSDMVK